MVGINRYNFAVFIQYDSSFVRFDVQMYIYKFVITNLFEECTNFDENRLN